MKLSRATPVADWRQDKQVQPDVVQGIANVNVPVLSQVSLDGYTANIRKPIDQDASIGKANFVSSKFNTTVYVLIR